MDSKQGIEKVAPVTVQAAGLLDPALLQPELNDTRSCPKDTLGNLPHRRLGSPTGSLARPEEFHKLEPYCLYVRVLRDSDAILEQDQWVPVHCWNAGISKVICKARTGVLLGTLSIDPLSDMEFLVYKLPKTGWGMTREEATLFVDLIRRQLLVGRCAGQSLCYLKKYAPSQEG